MLDPIKHWINLWLDATALKKKRSEDIFTSGKRSDVKFKFFNSYLNVLKNNHLRNTGPFLYSAKRGQEDTIWSMKISKVRVFTVDKQKSEAFKKQIFILKSGSLINLAPWLLNLWTYIITFKFYLLILRLTSFE